MRDLWVVLQREFWERVRSRSFLLSTLLTPLFFIGFGFGPMIMASNQARRAVERNLDLAVIDESPPGVGEEIQERLQRPPGEGEGQYLLIRLRTTLAEAEDSLANAVRAEQLDGFIHLPADLVDGGEVRVWSENGLSGGQRARIESAISNAVESERAGRMALDPANVARLLEPVPFRSLELDAEGGGGGSVTEMVMGLGANLVLYMLILLYGTQVMRSAQEEKANRVSEILVSSMRATHLMLGKVLGVGTSALLQVSIWGLCVAALLLNAGPLAKIGVPPEAVGAVLGAVDLSNLLMLTVFVLLGFFLYATLFAALGATAETMETAQRFTFPLTLPLLVPLMMGELIRANPSETLAVVLSWVPLTAPLVMPTRILFGGVGWVEAAASVVWLFFWVIAFGWLAGKIYRAGILNTGKAATWADVLRWAKAT